MHIQILDPKFKRGVWRYMVQASLAGLALFAILGVEGAHLSKAVIIAAIASSAFILFITPNSPTAAPRHVIGGHLLCLAIGSGFAAFDGTAIGREVLNAMPVIFDIEAAGAVALGILAMAATNTEHAPAAGTTLGVLTHQLSWSLVLLVVISVILLSIAHVLLRSRLRDLL